MCSLAKTEIILIPQECDEVVVYASDPLVQDCSRSQVIIILILQSF